MKFAKKFIALLASSTTVWIILRKILEVNFRGQKKIIKEQFPISGDDRVLDFGCGTGDFSVCFPKDSYTGVDINVKNIDHASRRYDKKFFVADGRALPFSNGYFTKVFIIGVLHHLDFNDCRRVLAEIERVLAPNGDLLIMEDTKTDFLPIKIIQHFDQGDFIRTTEEWRDMLAKKFRLKKEWVFKNGLCFYSAFLLNHKQNEH